MRANKFLGQHFLWSRAIVSKIIAVGGVSAEDTVLEVGPGKGILTEALASRACKVMAVEKDGRFVEYLGDHLAQRENLKIIHEDVLEFEPKKYHLRDGEYKIVANLPYYLTSRFLRLFLSRKPRPSSMTLMVQDEMASRINARPPHMNLLALSVQIYAKPKKEFRVSRSFFRPAPKVDSAILSLTDINNDFFKKNKISEERFFALAKKAFSQKRKTLRRSLGINSPKRPQELSLKDWVTFLAQFPS